MNEYKITEAERSEWVRILWDSQNCGCMEMGLCMECREDIRAIWNKLHALTEPEEPDTEWEECLACESEIIRIPASEIEASKALSWTTLKHIGATFHKRKPVEPVSVTMEYPEQVDRLVIIPHKINECKPFTVTFNQPPIANDLGKKP